jgi:cyclophilin family peptidyl-prolyl cis-trans isomerase
MRRSTPKWKGALCAVAIALGTPGAAAARDCTEPVVAAERVLLETEYGDLVLALYPEVAPRHVAQILDLVRRGAYDSTHIYRVIPGYQLQTSSILARLQPLPEDLADGAPKLPAELSELRHMRGTLSMTRRPDDPNSATSSFMIFLGPGPKLDGRYTVFGQLESGGSVVNRIVAVPLDQQNRPLDRLTIRHARVIEDIAAYYQTRPHDPIERIVDVVPHVTRQRSGDGAWRSSREAEPALTLMNVLAASAPIALLFALFSWLSRGRPGARHREHLALAAFIVIWLFPLGYMGMTAQYFSREVPRSLRFLHNSSCLFRRSVADWSEYYTQGLPTGSNVWEDLPDEIYSPMQPFGYESRMGFIHQANVHARAYNGALREREMADWYRHKFAELNPDKPPLRAWRVVRVRYAVGEPTPGAPGRWRTIPTRQLPPTRLIPIATVRFDQEGAL